MAKKESKELEQTQANPPAAPQAAEGLGKAEKEGVAQGGNDAEGHQNTPVDKGGETKPAGGKRPAGSKKAFPEWIAKEAKKAFATHDIDRIHFTSDGCGFGDPECARIHAVTLADPTVTTIGRNELN